MGIEEEQGLCWFSQWSLGGEEKCNFHPGKHLADFHEILYLTTEQTLLLLLLLVKGKVRIKSIDATKKLLHRELLQQGIRREKFFFPRGKLENPFLETNLGSHDSYEVFAKNSHESRDQCPALLSQRDEIAKVAHT